MNIYEEITNKIIDLIDKGEIIWQKPWISNFACKSGISGNPYSLLNQLLLGERPGFYYTFKQVKEQGGSVKKGSKASHIYFFTKYLPKAEKELVDQLNAENGGGYMAQERFCLKCYSVFHQDDITGVNLPHVDTVQEFQHELDSTAEKTIADYVQREKITLEHHKADGACYRPAADKVILPTPEMFADIAEYYSTAFHELSHSTLQPHRCNRPEAKGNSFGSKDYAREELVAEISAAMLCRATNVDTEKAFNNSVAYLQAWRKALSDDPAAIVWAASRAEKAAQFVLGQ